MWVTVCEVHDMEYITSACDDVWWVVTCEVCT